MKKTPGAVKKSLKAVDLQRFWVSWYEPADEEWDGRPLKVPPEWLVPGYWETGVTDDSMTYCAVVNAADQDAARAVVLKFWGGDDRRWRFCNPRASDWMPPMDRFKRKPA